MHDQNEHSTAEHAAYLVGFVVTLVVIVAAATFVLFMVARAIGALLT